MPNVRGERKPIHELAWSERAYVAATQPSTTAHSDVVSVAQQTSASTEQVSASTQETSASAEELAAPAHALANTATTLETLVSRFKTSV